MSEEEKLQFQMDDDLLAQAFEEAAKKSEAWMNDPNRKEYKPEEMIVEVGDHYFMTQGSDVGAFMQGSFPKYKSKHRRNYYFKKKNSLENAKPTI
ncbi:MAG TPA: hypothetical protein VFC84_00210 [Desulfosporosinus sp.]|nr:hypothetical protein [Desulfosporosinus sp.]